MAQPKLALSGAFDEVRHYLINEDVPYRPYGERFCSGVGPRAGVRFDAYGEHLGGNKFGGNHFIAKVSIHHVDYYVPLIDAMPLPHAENGLNWFDEPRPAEMRQVKFSFNFDNAKRLK